MSRTIPIKKFSFRIIVFSVIIAGLTLLFQLIFPQLASPALPYIVLFFFVITLFTIFIVLRDGKGKSSKRFASNYLLSRIIKLLSCITFLFIYIITNTKDAIKFAVAFLIIYFLYAAFEVFILKKESDDITAKETQEKQGTPAE